MMVELDVDVRHSSIHNCKQTTLWYGTLPSDGGRANLPAGLQCRVKMRAAADARRAKFPNEIFAGCRVIPPAPRRISNCRDRLPRWDPGVTKVDDELVWGSAPGSHDRNPPSGPARHSKPSRLQQSQVSRLPCLPWLLYRMVPGLPCKFGAQPLIEVPHPISPISLPSANGPRYLCAETHTHTHVHEMIAA